MKRRERQVEGGIGRVGDGEREGRGNGDKRKVGECREGRRRRYRESNRGREGVVGEREKRRYVI